MTIPYAIRDQFGGDGAEILNGFFAQLEAYDKVDNVKGIEIQRNATITAMLLVAKEIGEIEGHLHSHELHSADVEKHRSKGEEHIPTALYPKNLQNRAFELSRKLEPLIGEDGAKFIADRVTAYANRRLEETRDMMRGGD
jgi:hypothetical protein